MDTKKCMDSINEAVEFLPKWKEWYKNGILSLDANMGIHFSAYDFVEVFKDVPWKSRQMSETLEDYKDMYYVWVMHRGVCVFCVMTKEELEKNSNK